MGAAGHIPGVWTSGSVAATGTKLVEDSRISGGIVGHTVCLCACDELLKFGDRPCLFFCFLLKRRKEKVEHFSTRILRQKAIDYAVRSTAITSVSRVFASIGW